MIFANTGNNCNMMTLSVISIHDNVTNTANTIVVCCPYFQWKKMLNFVSEIE